MGVISVNHASKMPPRGVEWTTGGLDAFEISAPVVGPVFVWPSPGKASWASAARWGRAGFGSGGLHHLPPYHDDHRNGSHCRGLEAGGRAHGVGRRRNPQG